MRLVAVLQVLAVSRCLQSPSGFTLHQNNAEICTNALIIGSGISGLSCAKNLVTSKSVKPIIIEKSDRPGGRICTDVVQEFLLDRGFQIFIDSYPLVNKIDCGVIDTAKLELHQFAPGALVYYDGGFYSVSDPLRRPTSLVDTILTPIGTLTDKVKVGIYALLCRIQSLESIEGSAECSTLNYLTHIQGLSDAIVDRFFKPFYQAQTLVESMPPKLLTLELRMLAQGNGCLPRRGMEQVPLTVAASLPAGALRLNTKVTKIIAHGAGSREGKESPSSTYPHSSRFTVRAECDGQDLTFETDYVVIATDAPSARRLLEEIEFDDGLSRDSSSSSSGGNRFELAVSGILAKLSTIQSRSSTCVYYGLQGAPPVTEPVLVLNGHSDLSRPSSVPAVNNVCFPSQVAPEYAPLGRSLCSVTLVGSCDGSSDSQVDELVRQQLSQWWGNDVIKKWELLRIYRIDYAQPAQNLPYEYGRTATEISEGLYMCGDHVGTATLNGAIESGARVANQILAVCN